MGHELGLRRALLHRGISSSSSLLDQLPAPRQLPDWIARAISLSRTGCEPAFATIWNATNQPIGSTRYLGLRRQHQSLEIGQSWLASSTRSAEANLEANLLMLGRAFELGCLRVEFKLDRADQGARQAVEALGASFEGILRQHRVTPDGVRDTAIYSVIETEWPQLRGL